MKKISYSNQTVMDHALAYSINLEHLRKKYTLKFAIKVFRHVLRETKRKMKDKDFKKNKKFNFIDMIFPRKKDYDLDEYFNLLEDAGFRLEKFFEDFINEDSGEIVTIVRRKFKLLV